MCQNLYCSQNVFNHNIYRAKSNNFNDSLFVSTQVGSPSSLVPSLPFPNTKYVATINFLTLSHRSTPWAVSPSGNMQGYKPVNTFVVSNDKRGEPKRLPGNRVPTSPGWY